MSKLIVTVDGPAGVGKSTLAKNLAERLGIAYLDTGAMYRCIGLRFGEDISSMSDAELAKGLDEISFALKKIGNGYRLFCSGIQVGDEIRTERAGKLASLAGAVPQVRAKLQQYQRSIGESADLVAEGRDMGTKVFPRAEVKLFLDARPEVRASRRFSELSAKGIAADYNEILTGIMERDAADRSRAVDPLIPADDAVLVDTSDIDAAGVLEAAAIIVRQHEAPHGI